MKHIHIKWIGIAAATLFLSACGGKGTLNDQISLPMCSAEPGDTSASVLVPKGAEIEALEPDTKVRVWHYSNTDKMACTLSGSAVAKQTLSL